MLKLCLLAPGHKIHVVSFPWQTIHLCWSVQCMHRWIKLALGCMCSMSACEHWTPAASFFFHTSIHVGHVADGNNMVILFFSLMYSCRPAARPTWITAPCHLVDCIHVGWKLAVVNNIIASVADVNVVYSRLSVYVGLITSACRRE